MAITDRITGAENVVLFVHSGGTANLTGDMTQFSYDREQETADATAGADGARAYIPTVKKFMASMTSHFIGTAGSATWGSAALGAKGTVLFGLKGTAAGQPKGGFPAIITKQTIDAPFDDVVKLEIEFQGQGLEVFNPLKDVW